MSATVCRLPVAVRCSPFSVFRLSLAMLACAAAANAQAPNENWQTIRTQHFHVDFPSRLEPLARRAAGEAERAYERLATELATPRGPIDLIVTDEQDRSNGLATFFPTNHIVIWAHPPVDDPSLRFNDDWIELVVTHELTHIFHLDRTRGIWRLAQDVFGRHPSLFPNGRSPRWISEGIAVEYESKYGSGGRLNGSDLYETLEAVAARDASFLSPPRLSLATPYWPAGDLAYFGGAKLIHDGAHAGGDSAVRKFIERAAVDPIPYLWDDAAHVGFGATFGTLAARAKTTAERAPEPPALLTESYWDAVAPRWRGDTVFYSAMPQRETPGLYSQVGTRVQRLARRNSDDAFAFDGAAVVYAQLDYTDPYRLYSAIYRGEHALPNTERLSAPDVRRDGAIVAVETRDGGARLVVIDRVGAMPRALAELTPDVQWSAPRWSRSGDRIAAIRWTRGGASAIVVLDATGREIATYAEARAVQTHPSWDAGDRAIYFASDRTGRSAIWRVRLTGANAGALDLVSETAFGVTDPEVSPDGKTIAELVTTRDGVSLARMPAPSFDVDPATSLEPRFAAGLRDTPIVVTTPAHKYSPWRTLVPRYWVPTLGTTVRDNARLGFYTSSEDVVGQHATAFDGGWDYKTGEFDGSFDWLYHGLGVPDVNAAITQTWNVFGVVDSGGANVGEVARRNRTASLTATWTRPRVRSNGFVLLGTELEWRDFRAHPASLGPLIKPPLPGTLKYPSLVLSLGWSLGSRSAIALGPEDGVQFSVTGRRRWRTDEVSATTAHSVIGLARAYKSLPLPGHALHVIALRGAAGWAEPNITSLFSVGGMSGTSIDLLPGYTVGDVQRSFFVRGFPAGALSGIRAWSATAEYRAPLMRVGRGLWPTPLFWQRSALAVFTDAGSAWCPSLAAATAACPKGQTPRTTLASVGAEFLIDAALDYDSPTRFRIGVATPTAGKDAVGAKAITAYFTLGFPF